MDFYPIPVGKISFLNPTHSEELFSRLLELATEDIRKPSPPKLPDQPALPKLFAISDYPDFIPKELLDEDLKSEHPFFADHECGVNWIPVRDPVYDVRFKGHIYERKTILEWLKYRKISPLNQGPMTESDLADDVELKSDIDRRLNDWIAKQNAPILERHREAVRLHEKNVQEILARHNEAMQCYESAMEVEGPEKADLGGNEEEPRNVPYGAGLAQLRAQGQIERASLSSGIGADHFRAEHQMYATAMKTNRVDLNVFHNIEDCISSVPFGTHWPMETDHSNLEYLGMMKSDHMALKSSILLSNPLANASRKIVENYDQKFLDRILGYAEALERAKRAN